MVKDDIPYMKWKIKFMFQTTNQRYFLHSGGTALRTASIVMSAHGKLFPAVDRFSTNAGPREGRTIGTWAAGKAEA